MSILKYFSHTPVIVQDQGLPEPTSSLSNFIPFWNSLPPNLSDQPSLDDFRNLLNDIDFN